MRTLYIRFLPFVLTYFALGALTTLGLAIREWPFLSGTLPAILFPIVSWLLSSMVACLFTLVPYGLYLVCLPRSLQESRFDRTVTAVFFCLYLSAQLFKETAVLLFWEEFSSRFNFVAVDYLVYTQEVIGNVMESYPVGPLLAAIIGTALLVTWLLRNRLVPQPGTEAPVRFVGRGMAFTGLLLTASLLSQLPFADWTERADNRYNAELGKDDLYCLMYAFFTNELSYADFYITRPEKQNLTLLRRNLSGPHIRFQGEGLIRHVDDPQPEQRLNVIVVLMESMGSEFLSENRTDGCVLTPHLDALARKSLYFSKVYATGTRSVRGLEAVTLSIPPLPGMALVRRHNNGNLFSAGSVFRSKGYETKWIYGGYGYFDNMNAFFEANGFQVIDRTDMNHEEIHFSNVWGVCDEDLFARIVREADASYASGKPFLSISLTTSNHRPFTYPEGKVSIPSKSGRKGGVMYADYAIGAFLKEAARHPWFDDTVFVFVADHGAGSAGREEIEPENHRIPLYIYSPRHIASYRCDNTVSQMDVIPTLLGRLNWEYTGHFYGADALSPHYRSRIFLGNYQKIAYMRGNESVVLRPVKEVAFYRRGELVSHPGADENRLLDEAVSYYQYAAGWQRNLKLPSDTDLSAPLAAVSP